MNWYKQAKLTDAESIKEILKEAGLWDTLSKDISEFWPTNVPGFQKEKPKGNSIANIVSELKKAIQELMPPYKKRQFIENFFDKNRNNSTLQSYKNQIIRSLGFPVGISFE